jgi:hypothetical protein
MKLILEPPFSQVWRMAYIVTNTENRKNVVLFNSQEDRTTISYARYLMSVKMGSFISPEWHVDHINEDKTNDDINNLQLLSPLQNSIKQGLARRQNIHGTLATYRYCKCDVCKLGKRLYNQGKKQEYYQNIQDNAKLEGNRNAV